jgi:hypothetical protein
MIHTTGIPEKRNTGNTNPMWGKKPKEPEPKPLTKLTTLVTYDALDAIDDIQRHYRRTTGKRLPIWKIVDEAILAYAEKRRL